MQNSPPMRAKLNIMVFICRSVVIQDSFKWVLMLFTKRRCTTGIKVIRKERKLVLSTKMVTLRVKKTGKYSVLGYF